VPVEQGSVLDIADGALRIGSAASMTTDNRVTLIRGRVHPPMHLFVGLHLTEIRVDGRSTAVTLTGNPHKIVRAVVLCTNGGTAAVPWATVAGRIWKANPTEANWYTNLARLKDKLRDSGLPVDLVQYVQGQVSLAVRPLVDTVEVERPEAGILL